MYILTKQVIIEKKKIQQRKEDFSQLLFSHKYGQAITGSTVVTKLTLLAKFSFFSHSFSSSHPKNYLLTGIFLDKIVYFPPLVNFIPERSRKKVYISAFKNICINK